MNKCTYTWKFSDDYLATSDATHRDFKAITKKGRTESYDDSGNMLTVLAWTNRIVQFQMIVRRFFQFSRKRWVSFDKIWNIKWRKRPSYTNTPVKCEIYSFINWRWCIELCCYSIHIWWTSRGEKQMKHRNRATLLLMLYSSA